MGLKNLAGQKFGKLLVIQRDFTKDPSRTFWECICDCGKKRTYRSDGLICGKCTSCGCKHNGLPGEYEEYIKKRLIKYSKKNESSGCLEWQKTITTRGYGSISVRKKTCLTHRVSYEIFIGPIEEGKYVCHNCDNPKCINPEHLFLGTPKENSLDMVKKSRSIGPQGEKQGRSKLTEDQVRVILSNPDKPSSYYAKIYDVSRENISRVKNRKSWKHIRLC